MVEIQILRDLFRKTKSFFFLVAVAAIIFGGIFVAGLSSASAATANITKLVITTSPQEIPTDLVSSVITVQTQNASSSLEPLDTSGTTLLLTSSSPTGQFSSNATNWQSVTSLGMNNTWGNRNFYYKDSTAGTYTITITAQDQTWTIATQTIKIQGVITNSEGETYTSVQAAIDGTAAGGIITIPAGTYELSGQVNVTKPLTINGTGAILKAISDFGTANASKHLLSVYAGTEAEPVTISGLTFDCDSKCYGVNAYGNAYGVLNDVTVKNSKGAGLTVNGSVINATNLTTSGNSWGAVNVDPGSGVTTPSVFTLSGSNLAENTQIWSDGGHVSETATVTVNAEGYSVYKKGGTSAFFMWVNKPLSNVVTITDSEGKTTFYSTIQAAVTAASVGDTINVGAGTYTEGHVVINKNLTIAGADKATTIVKPSVDTVMPQGGVNPPGDDSGWFVISPGVDATITGLTFDGSGKNVGIAVLSHGEGKIDNNIIKNVRYGAYRGFGIFLWNALTTVSNNIFSGIERVGIILKGASTSADIFSNSYSGKGNGDWLDYGIELGAGAHGIITGNKISNNTGVASDGSTSAGMLVTTYYGAGTQATVNGNEFTNNTDGIAVGYDENDLSMVIMRSNDLSDNVHGVNSTHPLVDASNNWWGVVTPSDIASKVTGSVSFEPWYINPGMTVLSSDLAGNPDTLQPATGNIDFLANGNQASLPNDVTKIVLGDSQKIDLSNAVETQAPSSVLVGGSTVTLEKSVVLQSGTDNEPIIIKNSGLSNITVSIPDATNIQGPSVWDGAIRPPVSETGSGTAPAGFSVGNTVISIGSLEGTLTFDKPVTLTLASVTGSVGYKPAGSSMWIKITNACSGDYNNPGNPPALGECFISDGTDTKILTYHFTTFGSLVVIPPAPTPAPATGGGGSVFQPTPTPTPTLTPTSTPTPIPTPSKTPIFQSPTPASESVRRSGASNQANNSNLSSETSINSKLAQIPAGNVLAQPSPDLSETSSQTGQATILGAIGNAVSLGTGNAGLGILVIIFALGVIYFAVWKIGKSRT